LAYTCLLKSNFTEASHDRGFKTWQTPTTYPECVFCGKMYRWQEPYVECHMDPNISKATTGRERVVAACAESQSTSCVPNRTRFLAVQTTIHVKM
jgi:predicted alpha-1,6-mannanase (GH76 family)